MEGPQAGRLVVVGVVEDVDVALVLNVDEDVLD